MSTDDFRGITLNTKSMSFLVALVSLASVFWYSVSYIQGQSSRADLIEQRIAVLEQRQKADTSESKEDYQVILQKIDTLSDKITSLTISLNNIQYRQETGAAK